MFINVTTNRLVKVRYVAKGSYWWWSCDGVVVLTCAREVGSVLDGAEEVVLAGIHPSVTVRRLGIPHAYDNNQQPRSEGMEVARRENDYLTNEHTLWGIALSHLFRLPPSLSLCRVHQGNRSSLDALATCPRTRAHTHTRMHGRSDSTGLDGHLFHLPGPS